VLEALQASDEVRSPLAQPLVSFVTPCFRSARFLEGCIQSVLRQTYPRVEHVIQDGGSDDGTRAILERYPQVSWVSEADAGQNDGLDRALRRCRGDLILVLNADDELLPDAAQWGVEQLERFPEAGAVYGDQHIINEDGRVVDIYYAPAPYSFEGVLCVELVPPAQAAFLRRSALEVVGLGTDPALKTCPDYEMWVRLGLRFPVQCARGFVSRYRQHQGTTGALAPARRRQAHGDGSRLR
jgi:cellulose synthase/poly-beta-1,6-N-acetylglucosamine synthase-like glycosyltransferase